jgi:hypothetical protein
MVYAIYLQRGYLKHEPLYFGSRISLQKPQIRLPFSQSPYCEEFAGPEEEKAASQRPCKIY